MAMSPIGGQSDAYRPVSDINVTPLVDVMLVLLIVFMVAAPLMTVGVPLDLPEAKGPVVDMPKDPLVVSLDAAGGIFIGETSVPQGELPTRLTTLWQADGQARVYIKGDRRIDYGRMMDVMSAVQAAGFTHVSLLAEDAAGKGG
ncbi:MAG: biopolymer transporter ExbD [Magnetospirillum gryphiswaldense]|nr:biopolymer transporter ExbD [Magnetospirillum gryphiswaldense]